jgi:hypothetical protein
MRALKKKSKLVKTKKAAKCVQKCLWGEQSLQGCPAGSSAAGPAQSCKATGGQPQVLATLTSKILLLRSHQFPELATGDRPSCDFKC